MIPFRISPHPYAHIETPLLSPCPWFLWHIFGFSSAFPHQTMASSVELKPVAQFVGQRCSRLHASTSALKTMRDWTRSWRFSSAFDIMNQLCVHQTLYYAIRSFFTSPSVSPLSLLSSTGIIARRSSGVKVVSKKIITTDEERWQITRLGLSTIDRWLYSLFSLPPPGGWWPKTFLHHCLQNRACRFGFKFPPRKIYSTTIHVEKRIWPQHHMEMIWK